MAEVPAASFDLTEQPWIPVRWLDGTRDEVSLRELFARAGEIRRITGDLATQEFALLRLLLALLHDAVDGPADAEAWAELWEDEDAFAPVAGYLDAHRGRFDLLHVRAPFFQVPGLRTGKDEVFSLSRIVADVPTGKPYLSARMPTVERLEFAEAARWLVHAHAYDTSGIKTGVEGDPRAKGGKVYPVPPLGVAWTGNLGGVFAEGATLRETLLLNLIAADTAGLRFSADDAPAWRRPVGEPGPGGGNRTPAGPRDLYTWQTRRVRLHHDADGVHGVVLSYGDPLAPHNRHGVEPMTAWRRSQAQEKKLKQVPVYLPRQHDPSRAAWRGLAALIADRPGGAQHAQAAPILVPPVLEWVARLTSDGFLPRHFQIRARTIGAVYGTQQSVIDEVVDDRVAMKVVLLHRQHRRHAEQAKTAVSDSDDLVRALGDLAHHLARACGASPDAMDSAKSAARDLGYAALDGPYRTWLSRLGETDDPVKQRDRWRETAVGIVGRLGERLLIQAGDPAWEGRVIELGKREVWANSSLADRWFRRALRDALAQGPDSSESSPTGNEGVPRMPVPTAPPPTAPQRVRKAATALIAPLQGGYLADRPDAVAALARLRRGAGRDIAQVADLWGLLDTTGLHEVPDGERALSEPELAWAENAVHIALTLWALHQQSRATAMHRVDSKSSPARLGSAVRRLMPRDGIDEAVRKRFVRIGTATDLDALAERLRTVILLLRRADIPLDYGLLAEQLYRWQAPGGREAVRRSWGSSFHAPPTKSEADPATPPDSEEKNPQ